MFWEFSLAAEFERKRGNNRDALSPPPPGRLFWRQHPAAPPDRRAPAPAVGPQHLRPRRHRPAVVPDEAGRVSGAGRHVLCVRVGPPGERSGACGPAAHLSRQVSLGKPRVRRHRWLCRPITDGLLSWFMYKATILYSCVHLSALSDSATPWTAARQTPLSMGFSRQEYWSGLLCPSPSLYSLIFIYLNLNIIFIFKFWKSHFKMGLFHNSPK